MNVKILAFLLFVISISLCACKNDKGKDIPDVSAINAAIDLKRFDQSLFSLDTNDVSAGLSRLEQEYGEFAAIYFGQILGSKDQRIAPEGHETYVKGFLAHPGARQLYDTTQVIYPDLAGVEQDLEQAFRFFKYYFPEQPLSGEVVTYISEYTIGGFLYGENSIGIGLDFYLGESYPYQQYIPANPNFSAYLTRTFNQDHIAMKSVKLLVQDLLGSTSGNQLLDHMIHNGKELYLLDRLLPHLPDSVKLEYSQQQVDWVNENEANIWAYLIAEDLIYSPELDKFRKYVEYSPNSPGMPEEAPGRTASWLGWQIVKAFMDRHPEMSLQELINLRDGQVIMDQSKYKPRRR